MRFAAYGTNTLVIIHVADLGGQKAKSRHSANGGFSPVVEFKEYVAFVLIHPVQRHAGDQTLL
jgi:hypothetical protein